MDDSLYAVLKVQYIFNMAQWLSWLERRPVTAEVESSSLFWVVLKEKRKLLFWDLSSAGRASALQAEGHRFEPCRSHFHKASNAGVAELADAQDLKSCGTYTPVPVRFRSSAPKTTVVKFRSSFLLLISKMGVIGHFVLILIPMKIDII